MTHNLSLEATMGTLVLTSLFLLAATFFSVLLVSRLENKLLLLGLSAAMAAVLYGSVLGDGAFRVQATAGQPSAAGPVALTGHSLAGGLMKIAFVLVLGGVAAGLWSHWTRTALPSTRENPSPYRENNTDVK